jgi:hypothetical protein
LQLLLVSPALSFSGLIRFMPRVFSVSGSAWPSIAVVMILNDFCLLPRKIANGEENFVLQLLQFQQMNCLHAGNLVNDIGTDRTDNIFLISACSRVAGETTCPQSCSLGMAIRVSLVYQSITCERICISQYMQKFQMLANTFSC